MQKSRVLLITYPSSVQGHALGKKLSSRQDLELTILSPPAVNGKTFETQTFDLLLFDCDSLTRQQVAWLEHLSRMSNAVPLIILAFEISLYAFQQIAKMNHMVTLQKPYNEAVFDAILGRLLASEKDPAARLPRFITDQPVRMLVMNSGLLIPTRMKNYSAGGAFLEYRGISLKVGDRLQLRMDGETVTDADAAAATGKEETALQAKVIWIKDGDNPRSPARGVGVQFIDTGAKPVAAAN